MQQLFADNFSILLIRRFNAVQRIGSAIVHAIQFVDNGMWPHFGFDKISRPANKLSTYRRRYRTKENNSQHTGGDTYILEIESCAY